MNYSAYLRVYEPLSAFHEPGRSRWVAYAASSARPRRRDALAAEHAERLRRLVTRPGEAVPRQESEHAYVRYADGMVFICPWQTRLRSLIATESAPWMNRPRPHIWSSNWTVPLAWFVPFAGAERWAALGQSHPPGSQAMAGDVSAQPRVPPQAARASASPQVGRTLVYVAQMSLARRRAARGLVALRGMRRLSESAPRGEGSGKWNPMHDTEADLAAVGRWLEGFHPRSLVELDYGGLVHLLTDEALCGDESVAELAAAIDGMSRGYCELAIAMFSRALARWQTFREFEQVN